MELRIRCPHCRTVLKVKPGTRPTCPGCGFAGAGIGDPEQGQPVEFTATAEPVRFTRTDAPSGQAGAAGAADAGWQPAEGGWQEATPAEGWGAAAQEAPDAEPWEDTGGGWQTQPKQPAQEPQRKRFRLFSGRR